MVPYHTTEILIQWQCSQCQGRGGKRNKAIASNTLFDCCSTYGRSADSRIATSKRVQAQVASRFEHQYKKPYSISLENNRNASRESLFLCLNMLRKKQNRIKPYHFALSLQRNNSLTGEKCGVKDLLGSKV